MSTAQADLEQGACVRRGWAQGLVWALGLSLVVAAILADQAWFDRHFLPVFFVPPRLYQEGEAWARTAVGLLGMGVLLWVRPSAALWAAKRAPRTMLAEAAFALLALVLAAAVSEAALRLAFPRAAQEASPTAEPLRVHDARLGWTFKPSRTARVKGIDYAFDAQGARIPDLAHPADPAKPSILFVGESVVTGSGLAWPDTFGARAGAVLGLQPVNLGVYAYADDQTFMRLAQQLPRFAQPKAVVILFSPGLMFRDFDDDRPHLEPGLVWAPARPHSRLAALIHFFAPYHTVPAVDRRVALAHDALRAGVALAHGRGAQALIVVPRFGPEDPRETVLRRRVLEGLPFVAVELDPAWRLPRDPHPDAQGAKTIAEVVVAALREGVKTPHQAAE